MDIFQAIVYGIVQGITEFLPISSTAHLNLLPWIVGWQQPDVVFDIALHFGTAVAVILFFAKDWVRIIGAGVTKPKSPDGRLFWFIVAATIPGAVAGVFLSEYTENFSPLLTGILLVVMGAVLYVCDRYSRSEIDMKGMGFGRSLLVGLAQVLAILPGVSRSGITMSVGRATGMERPSIAKFTFLMSTPLILGDALYHAKDLPGMNVPVTPFVVGVVTSAIVGLLAIKFLLDFLRKRGFLLFTIYRFAFGGLVILLALFR